MDKALFMGFKEPLTNNTSVTPVCVIFRSSFTYQSATKKATRTEYKLPERDVVVR